MTDQDALNLIRTLGDPLEKTMFADGEFMALFFPYVRIWSDFVFPNRQPDHPMLTVEIWRPLAQSHYTAAVRCWHVLMIQQRIEDLCLRATQETIDGIGKVLLDLHEATGSFFEHAGAAIDTLSHVHEVYPLESVRKEGSKPLVCRADDDLAWIYDRRTQNIHTALVPCFVRGGVPYVALDSYMEKNTDWRHTALNTVKSVADYFRDQGSRFSKAMSVAWNRLYSALRNEQEPPRQSPPALSPNPEPSGSPRHHM